MERVEPSQLHNSIQEAMQSNVTVLPQAFGGAERGTGDADSQDRGATDFKAIQPHPANSGAAFLVAGLFSLFWIGGILAYISGYLGQGGMERIPTSWWGILAAVLAIPTAMAWFVAYVIRESRLLRLQAQGLATAAAALLQPDDHAARGVNKLGRVLRRELDNFNVALEAAMGRMAQLETTNAQRLEQLEKAASQAQERVEKAAGKLGSERDKFQAFTQSLDASVMQVNESLTARVQEARVAARAAADSLQTEQTAILSLIEALKTSAMQASAQANEAAKEVERQAQRLDSAAEAAAARSEQVMARHERHRAALTDTLERLRSENDHMTKALEAQRDAFSKLTLVMGEEAKRIDAFAGDGLRRIDQATAQLSNKIQTFAADSIQRIDTATAALGERVTSVAASAGETLAGATKTLDAQLLDAAKTLDAQLLGVSQTAAHTIDQASATLETRLAALQSTATRSVDEATARAAAKFDELNKTTATVVAEASRLLGQRFNDVNKSAIQSIDGSAAILTQRIAQAADAGNKSLEASVAGLAQKISEISNQSGVQADAAMTGLSSRIAEFSSDTMRKLEASAGALSQKILETAKAFAAETENLRNQSEAAALSLDQTARTVRSSGETATAVSSTLNEELKHVHTLASETSERIEAGLISLKKLMSDLPAEAAGHVETLRSMVDGQAAQILDLSARVHQAFEQIQMIEMHRQAWAAVPAPGAPMRAPSPVPMQAMPQTPAPAPIPVAPAKPQTASTLPAPAATSPMASGSAAPTDGTAKAAGPVSGPSDPGASVAASPAAVASAQGASPPAEVRSWLNLAKRLVRITGGEDGDSGEQQPRNWDIKQLLAAAESPAPQLDSATATRHMMETLQAMAIDLDRLIEDEPPLELLRRYRSGERNIFARRLVQILGRDQSERIVRKYKSDPEFLETVDRYCQQFEALMDEAAAKDREGMMAETFLTSQTGKVYLFLASAIGRIH